MNISFVGLLLRKDCLTVDRSIMSLSLMMALSSLGKVFSGIRSS